MQTVRDRLIEIVWEHPELADKICEILRKAEQQEA